MAQGAIGIAIDPTDSRVLPIESQLLISVIAIGRPFPHQIADDHAFATEAGRMAMGVGRRIVNLHLGFALVIDV